MQTATQAARQSSEQKKNQSSEKKEKTKKNILRARAKMDTHRKYDVGLGIDMIKNRF